LIFLDFLPRQQASDLGKPLLFWLIRRVEVNTYHVFFITSTKKTPQVVRGTIPLRIECAPAFNYARDAHTTSIILDDTSPHQHQHKVLFKSHSLSLDLRHVAECDSGTAPDIQWSILDLSAKGHLGPAVCTQLDLFEGAMVTFVFRSPPHEEYKPMVKPTQEEAHQLGVPLERTCSFFLFSTWDHI
jgi:hypothetical protein